jgi:hypothetical protein
MPVIFDQVFARDLLLRDKGFLYELYRNSSIENRNQITGAEDRHLDTLILILYLIVNNEIPTFEEQLQQIKKAKKKNFLKKHFEHHKDFTDLLEGPRNKKVNILRQLSLVFPFLLAALFEE